MFPPVAFLFTRKPRLLEFFKDLHDRRERIRCPVCGWQPTKADRWCCAPDGCGHIWNTFETRALCPGCSKQWTHTDCLKCLTSSPHEDWYEREDQDP